MKAEDIGSYDVTPSWEREPREEDPRLAPYTDTPSWDRLSCKCGLCQLAAAGHL
ncbi:hypothetical protein FHT44_005196 [Mycolicibacterium sp. BK634]|uniref:hypothetical protein n=1 Tax=Mycolicibacterium sp. BK634 TaxID=2587099 RepID=UPI00162114BD|nr:hypothetical protein [Mycolicibacterium sp. BK634]MBB3752684.1 hypothetical protein [Mycolicibacterium sp. BK634]